MQQRLATYLILLLFTTLQAQSKASYEGDIVDLKSHRPIPFAVIHILETEQWTTSDAKGHFSFQGLAITTFTIRVQSLGYQEFLKTYKDQNNITILLKPLSYDMPEIVVTAKQGQGLSTTTKINSAAMEHVQASTLGDVMQLLPGQLISNPDLSDRQMLSIREIGYDDNSADGTAVIVDGAPLSNDADMQSNSLRGIDLRRISTDNIESIEVIKGIPSVSYGNLSSGAVLVNTKSGYAPYQVKLKTDPKLKLASISKGIRLSKGGALNTTLNYTRSFADLRSKYEGYNRLTAQLGYSKTFCQESSPLSFNTKLSFHNTLDQEKTDPDALQPEELFRRSEAGVRLNTYGQWALNKALITNLKYTVRTSITKQEDYDKCFRSSSLNRISYALEEGENEGIYLASESLTELTTKGLPASLYAQLSANKNISTHWGLINNTMLGLDYTLDGNYGEGRIYDIMNPPTISYSSSRPRSFKDVPASKTLAFFAENKVSIPIYTSTLDLMAGFRLNNFQATSLVAGDVGLFWEPRLNLRYRLLEHKQGWLQKVSIHGGIGLNYKAPSLSYLYPAPAYFDVLTLDYYPSDPSYAQVWFNTHIINDTGNPDLKPSQNLKKELGISFKIRNIVGHISYFDEALSQGFGYDNKYYFTHNISYISDGIADNTAIDKSTLPTREETYIFKQSFPVNNKASNKQGIEYSFDFGRIKALSTKITMNGAWLRTERTYSTMDYKRLPFKSIGSGQYQEVGVYPSGESKVSERLNTTFRLVTHIPKMRLIFTTSVQVTWIDKYHYPYYDEAPRYLVDEQGSIIPFTDDMRTEAPYSYDYIETKGDNYYLTESRPPLVLCNFKLSKEMGQHLKLSFYANNFFNHRPIYLSERSFNYSRRNPSIYFGAELHYDF